MKMQVRILSEVPFFNFLLVFTWDVCIIGTMINIPIDYMDIVHPGVVSEDTKEKMHKLSERISDLAKERNIKILIIDSRTRGLREI